MKRCLQTFAVSLAFLIVIASIGYVAAFIPLGFWEIFGIASGILAAGIIVSVVYRKNYRAKIVSMFINAVAMGFYLRSWYINRGFENSLLLMLGVALLASLYLLLFILPLYIDAINRYYGWYLLVFTVLSIAGYICLVVLTKTTWVSTLGFFGLLDLGFIMTMSMDANNKHNLYNSWLIASYTVGLCAVIILLIVVGGDAADGIFEGSGSGDLDGISKISSPRKLKPKEEQAANFTNINQL